MRADAPRARRYRYQILAIPELLPFRAMTGRPAPAMPACALLIGTWCSALAIETPKSIIDHPSANRVVKIEFGLAANDSLRWTGQARVSPGTIHSTWGWNFNRPDRIDGSAGWDLEARPLSPEGARYTLRHELPGGRRILPNGVFLSVEAPPSATISITTNRGDFRFRIADLEAAGRLEFLDGDVAAVPAPAVRALTRGEASQHDFPAAVATEDGLFVAWTTYHNEANALYLAWLKDGNWRTRRVTPDWGDYFGTAVASDADGRIHVMWSEYLRDRWRLVDRAFDPKAGTWDDATFVAPDGERQLFPVAVTATDGRIWVCWQEFRNNDLEIMAAWYEDRWSEPVAVSESAANDWAPDLAAAPDGSVWAAWDSYARGRYDISVRQISTDGLGPVVPVAPDPNRAIEPAIAVDARNRVWLAWAESGPNWGKDWGVLGRPGTQLRESSEVRLAMYADGRWFEPMSALRDSVPAWMSDLHEYPSLAIGDNGVPYVFFRKSILRLPVEEHELRLQFGSEQRVMQPWYDTIRGMSSIQITGFDGKGWLPVRELPLSDGGAYAQLALARTEAGTAMVWPTDGRTYQDPHVRTSQIRYALARLDARYAADERLRPLRPDSEEVADAAPTEAADLEAVRAARWPAKAPLRLFRGDLHRHTDLSADSQRDGDILFQYRYALDAGALDFLAVTDHSGAERLHFYKYQWWKTRQIATMFNRPGRFATFFGYERTVTFPGGHRNVISTRREMQPVPISDEEFTGSESWAERLYPELVSNGDIAIAHTTAGGGGTDWRDNDVRAEPVVEVFQALRGSYEEENSPGRARTTEPAGFVWSAWRKGWRIGLLSNSDHESTHQSYACVWAPELTGEAILDAIKQRKSYAATDNIVLRFEARVGAGSPLKMGAEAVASRAPTLSFSARATAPVSSLEIVRNGEIVYAAEPLTREVSIEYRDQNPIPATGAQYHVRFVQDNGQIAWSTPIWVDQRPPIR